MKVKKEHILLFLLFIFSLVFRLYFVLQTSNFNSDDAYFHLRHISSLVENKEFLSYDGLSYGGRYVLYPPLFHLLMAVLTFGNIFLLKLIPEILLSLMVIIIYFICKEITNRRLVALICAFMSAFIPIFLTETINKLSVYSLVLLILFLMFYCLTKLDKKFYLILFLILSFLLPLIHPSAFLFILTLGIYFLLAWVEGVKVSKLKKEATIFSIFLICLIEFIIYRKAFLEYGLNIIFYNVPANILGNVFRSFDIISLIFFVGFLILIFGFFGLYYCIAHKDNKLGLIFSSFILGVLILLLFRLISFFVGLMFLSLGLVVLSSLFIMEALNYLEQTKFFRFKVSFIYIFLIIILLFSFIPAYDVLKSSRTIVDQQIHDMEWINKNTPQGTVVLGLMQEGNLISAIAKRINVADSNFLLAPNPLKRLEEINIIYSTGSGAIASKYLAKYNIKYIYFSDNAQSIYGTIKYIKDDSCFKQLRGRIYEIIC